jgi:hypothetical protein
MPVQTNLEREFKVGETVHLRARTSRPGTKTPLDVTQVRLTSLKREGVETLGSAQSFTRAAEGDYVLSVATAALQPGTYSVVAVADQGPTSVVVLTDEFELVAV